MKYGFIILHDLQNEKIFVRVSEIISFKIGRIDGEALNGIIYYSQSSFYVKELPDEIMKKIEEFYHG